LKSVAPAAERDPPRLERDPPVGPRGTRYVPRKPLSRGRSAPARLGPL